MRAIRAIRTLPGTAGLLAILSLASSAAWGASITIERHRPCNLFDPGEAACLQARLEDFPQGKGEAVAILSDAFGKEVWKQSFPLEGKADFAVDMGKPGRGYYELKITAKVRAQDGTTVEGSGKASLGIMESVRRSAAEVREKGYRFGVKWWGGVQDKKETLEMMARLGLQWTRVIHNEGGEFGTVRMLTDFPLNAVIKVERFPQELFDTEKYGSLQEWEKKFGRGTWTLKTLPRKAPYQKWLSEELAKIPKEQRIFEIWNEPWDKMSPEDFATLCQWIVEVIRKDRPDAILGPNLGGSVSDYDYDAKMIQTGGMKGMNMVCLHPYGGAEDRGWLRGYRKWISEKAGQPIDIYITEYGAHSAPEGPAKTSELEQARRVVRQSLALYAEDCKALIPHWVGQSEQNPTYHEDWFGYIRRNQEPKPVLLAHANSARLIDGGRYVGDLWFGPGVAAMLFEKEGKNTLALWTQGDAKEIEIEADAPELVLSDTFGRERTEKATAGKLKLSVGQDVLYVSGLGAGCVRLASKELRPDRWPKPEKPPRNARAIHKLRPAPQMDGKLDEWRNTTQLALINPKVNGDDASGTGYLAWDEKHLYLAVEMRDNEVLNTKPRAKLYQHDSIELFFSAEPRDNNPGYGPNDRQYFLAPTSGEGKPIVGMVADREAGEIQDVKDAKYFFGKTGKGWVAEVAIPWEALPKFRPAVGAKAALEIRVNDADSSHERWKIDPTDGTVNPGDPTVWSLLLLAE